MIDECRPVVTARQVGVLEFSRKQRKRMIHLRFRSLPVEDHTAGRIKRHISQICAILYDIETVVSRGEIILFYTRRFIEYEIALEPNPGMRHTLEEKIAILLGTAKQFLHHQGRFIDMAQFAFNKKRRVLLTLSTNRRPVT